MSQVQSVPYVVHDANGRISHFGRAAIDDIPLQAGPGQTAIIALGDDANDWVNPATGLLESRPALSMSPTATLAVGAEWELGLVPAGTAVLVDGELTHTTEGDALVLQFSIAAAWQVELVPPFPWKPARCVLETV